MIVQRIPILGTSGSGTTTLGRAVADCLNHPHFDTDDYFWIPTNPPYIEKRECSERQHLLKDDLTSHDSWILSGSLCGWGDGAIPLFELVVFLWIPSEIRLERLCQREHERYGERIMPGGDMYEKSQEFLEWAAAYDNGDVDMRSRQRHEQWLSSLPCPIIFIEGGYTIEEQLAVLMAEIQR